MMVVLITFILANFKMTTTTHSAHLMASSSPFLDMHVKRRCSGSFLVIINNSEANFSSCVFFASEVPFGLQN